MTAPVATTLHAASGRGSLASRFACRHEALAAKGARLWWRELARGVALFLGLFSLLNVAGELRVPGLDANLWWLDLRPLPTAPAAIFLSLAGVLLSWWGIAPARTVWRRLATSALAGALALVALLNSVAFYRVWQAGEIRPSIPLPLSLLLAGVLLSIVCAAWRPGPSRSSRGNLLLVAVVVVACGVLFPLAQQLFFGTTTYLRSSQVTIVFGAQVHASGEPSNTLAERVRTAAGLYNAGRTECLLMSGGQGADEPTNEAIAMRALAIRYGVPASAIELDPAGVNTDATVRNTVSALRATGHHRVAVVSDFFHLPRIKLAYQRAGLDVITVPSRSPRISQTAFLVAREVPAFWLYYFRAIGG